MSLHGQGFLRRLTTLLEVPMTWAKRAAAGLTVAAVLGAGTATQADDKPMLVVLPTGALPLGVSSGGTVVGFLRSGGGFYWMPTSGVVCTSVAIRRSP